MDVKDKVAIITGGANGFGLHMACDLVRRGARVYVLDVDPEGELKLRQQIEDFVESQLSYLNCDITAVQDLDAALKRIVEESSRVDILVNNAGILFSAPLVRFTGAGFERHSREDWDRVIQTNLSAVFYLSSSVAECMVARRTKGLIVNISSISAKGNPGQSAYAAAKAGVSALTAVWAKELGIFGIRVAAIAPGFFDTESTRVAISDAIQKDIAKRTPLRRLGKAEELLSAFRWILENDFFNGKVLDLDGGLII